MDLLTPEILIRAYSQGFFPMAAYKYGEIYWHSPEERAIFPLDSIKISRSMKQLLNKGTFKFTINYNFEKVIRHCAEREDTWISDEIVESYIDLHKSGFAHSLEVWKDDKICGGLYGVAIGGAFFGESMYNEVPNAAKAGFYFLVAHLLRQGFILLDSQYLNDFTAQLGAIEIPREEYLALLQKAIMMESSQVSFVGIVE